MKEGGLEHPVIKKSMVKTALFIEFSPKKVED
jgi:hypothetical protein